LSEAAKTAQLPLNTGWANFTSIKPAQSETVKPQLTTTVSSKPPTASITPKPDIYYAFRDISIGSASNISPNLTSHAKVKTKLIDIDSFSAHSTTPTPVSNSQSIDPFGEDDGQDSGFVFNAGANYMNAPSKPLKQTVVPPITIENNPNSVIAEFGDFKSASTPSPAAKPQDLFATANADPIRNDDLTVIKTAHSTWTSAPDPVVEVDATKPTLEMPKLSTGWTPAVSVEDLRIKTEVSALASLGLDSPSFNADW
jgi:hypothetical protein